MNSPTMQVAFAGSSNFIWFDFNKTVLNGARISKRYIEDIQGDLVVKYLEEERNVPEERAADLVEQWGSRLRLVVKCATVKKSLQELDEIYEDSLGHLKIFYKFV